MYRFRLPLFQCEDPTLPGAPSPEHMRACLEIPGVRRARRMPEGVLDVPDNAAKILWDILASIGVTPSISKLESGPRNKKAPTPQFLKEMVEDVGISLKDFLTGYQKREIETWGVRGNFLMQHATGAGKTVTSIVSTSIDKSPIVILTSAKARTGWARQLARYTTAKSVTLFGQDHIEAYEVATGLELAPGSDKWAVGRWREALKAIPVKRAVNDCPCGEPHTPEVVQYQGMEGFRHAYARYWLKAGKHRIYNRDGFYADVGIKAPEIDKDTRYVICAWETLAWHADQLVKLNPGAVILDEVQRAASNKRWEKISTTSDDPQAKVLDDGSYGKFQRLENTASSTDRVCKSSSRVIALSATPIRDRVRNLWAILDYLAPGEFGNYRSFTKRYCLPVGAPVWMCDMTHKPIEALKIGDEVWGWAAGAEHGRFRRLVKAKVLETFERKAEVIEATLESGCKVMSTRDHLWANASSAGRAIPYRVLSAGGGAGGNRNAPTQLARVLDKEHPVGETSSREYKLGYVHGLVDGDGTMVLKWHLRPAQTPGRWFGERRRVVSLRLDDANLEALDRYEGYLRDLGLAPSRHKYKRMTAVNASGREAVALFHLPRAGDDNYWRGWLAGIYDAEGWNRVIAQYEVVNPETYANIVDALKRFDFVVSGNEEAVTFLGKDHAERSIGAKGGIDPCRGSGMQELARFWALVRPAITRKMDPLFDMALFWAADKVMSIKSLGEQPVFDVKTTTGNFVAYGYGSHNCSGHENTWGGWDDKGSSNLDELFARVAFYLSFVSPAEAAANLPPLRNETVFVTRDLLTEGDADLIRDVSRIAMEEADGDAASGFKRVAEVKLALACSRKRKVIAADAVEAANSGLKVCIFTARRRDVTELKKILQAKASGLEKEVRLFFGDGSMSPEERGLIRDEYMACPSHAILVGTGYAFGEAVDLQDTDIGMLAMLPWTISEYLQWRGRWYRQGGKRALLVKNYVAEGTVDEHISNLLLSKLPAIETMNNGQITQGVYESLVGNVEALTAEIAGAIMNTDFEM